MIWLFLKQIQLRAERSSVALISHSLLFIQFQPNILIFFSLRPGDLIWRSCRSVRPSVIDFLIFQQRGFESIISDLSNKTKLTLLESLLREATTIVRLPNPKLSTVVWLPNPELNTVVRLPNRKSSALVRLQNPKYCSRLTQPKDELYSNYPTQSWVLQSKYQTQSRIL